MQDAQPAEGLPLHAAQAAVAVVAGVVDQDAHAAQGRALGHVLGLVDVVAFEVQQHRDAQDRAALDARLGAAIGVVAGQVDDDQHGPLEADTVPSW